MGSGTGPGAGAARRLRAPLSELHTLAAEMNATAPAAQATMAARMLAIVDRLRGLTRSMVRGTEHDTTVTLRPERIGVSGLLWGIARGEEDRLREGGRRLEIDVADVPDRDFTLDVVTEVNPDKNTELQGLYRSKGIYCTQCEAEGFRRITYYPDRPDVMAVFEVTINGPHPVLLSNGNPVAQGPNHAQWHDPHPKPAYLFALVAGDLVAHSDSFTTMGGKTSLSLSGSAMVCPSRILARVAMIASWTTMFPEVRAVMCTCDQQWNRPRG